MLFKPGTWLEKPSSLVTDSIKFISEGATQILDLGCGVGRHSIHLAQAVKNLGGNVTCVDILPSALCGLVRYAKRYDVEETIIPILIDVEHFWITENKYDYIAAISCIEHVGSKSALKETIQRMILGTKEGGVNCIIMNTEIRQYDATSLVEVTLCTELNLLSNYIVKLLNNAYSLWEIKTCNIKTWKNVETIDGKPTIFSSKYVRFIAIRRSGSYRIW